MREPARLCAGAGREPARVTVVLGEPDEAMMERCVKAGVYRCAIALVPRHPADVDSLLDRCASLAVRFIVVQAWPSGSRPDGNVEQTSAPEGNPIQSG